MFLLFKMFSVKEISCTVLFDLSHKDIETKLDIWLIWDGCLSPCKTASIIQNLKYKLFVRKK